MADSKRPRKLRRLVVAIIVLFTLGLIGLLLLPSLLSTGMGRNLALSFVNDAVPGNITVESWSLSWGGPQQITGLGINTPDGANVLTVKDINAADLSLWATLRGSTNFGTIKLDGIDGTVEQYPDGSTNLQRAFVAKEADTDDEDGDPSDSAGGGMPSARIEWTNANLSVIAPGIEPVSITGLTGHADLTDIAAIDLALAASVKQANTVGQIDATAKLTDMIDDVGSILWADAGVNANVTLRDLPVDAVDRIASLDGRLTALLGPILNANVKANGKLSSTDFAVTVEAASANLTECRLTAGYTDNDIVLHPDSGLSLTMTPAAWQVMFADADKQAATLIQPFTLRADIGDFRVARDYRNLAGSANITLAVEDIVLDAADQRIGRVALRNTRASFTSQDLATSATITLDAVAEQGGRSGGINVASTLTGEFTGENPLSQVAATVSVNDTPLAIFDQLASLKGQLVNALGDTMTATAKIDYDLSKKLGDVTLAARSNMLSANLTAKATDKQIIVANGSKIQYLLNPAFANAFMGDKRTVSLIGPVRWDMTITRMHVPRTGETIDMKRAVMDVIVKGEDIQLNDGNAEPLVFAAPVFTLVTQSADKPITAQMKTDVRRGSRSGQIAARATVDNAFTDDGSLNKTGLHANVIVGASSNLLGSVRPLDKVGVALGKLAKQPFKLSLDAQMVKPTDASKTAATFTYTLDAGEVHVNLPGKIDGDQLTLNQGASVTAAVDQVMLDALTGADPQVPAAYVLASPAKVTLSVNKFNLLIGGDQIGAGALDVDLKGDTVKLTATDPAAAVPTIELRKLNVVAKAENARALLAVGGGADVVTAGQSATIAIAAGVKDIMGTPTLTRARIEAPALPTALVNVLMGPELKLPVVLGETLAIDVTAEPDGAATKFDANLTVANLKLTHASGLFTSGQSVKINRGLEMQYTLTPQAFAALRPQAKNGAVGAIKSSIAKQVTGSNATAAGNWTLQKPVTFTIQLPKDATIGLNADNAIDYAATSLALGVGGQDLTLSRGANATYTLSGLQAEVDMAKPAEQIVITAKANMSQVGTAGSGQLTSQTRLTHALAADGSLDIVNATINTHTQGKSLPSAMLDGLAGTDEQLSQMFGPTIEMAAVGNYPGNLDISVKGELGDVQLPVTVDADRVLTMQRDGTIEFTATTELADSVLRNINPFLADAVRGRDPIRIDLKQEGTRIPLKDFNIANANASALVNLGTLELGEGGFLGKLRGLLGRSSRSSYNATFSPTLVQLAQGWLTYRDMRMTIEDEKFALVYATRMHVDPDSARELEMTVTVPGDVIAASVKELQGSLTAADGLTIPIRGTIDEPKPDMGGFQKSLRDLIAKGAIRRGIGDALGDDAAGEAAGALLEGLFGGKKK